MRGIAAALLAVLVAACDSHEPAPSPSPSANGPLATATASAAPTAIPAVATPPSPVIDSNPFHLPARRIALDPGRRVFTVSDQMLAGAKIGSTLVLYAANVVGLDGDDVVVEGRGGPSYKVQAAYVIPVPDEARVKPGDAVLTEWSGAMKHAVVTKLVKDRVGVRYTDLDAKTPEGLLKNTTRFVKQIEGLVPGNYAALAHEGEWEHVLLVSPFTEGDKKRWLALGFGGAALLCDESALKAIPIRYAPKVNAPVLAEWAGKMRKATVTASETQGLFTVKYDRAGKPATVGWGLLMPPAEASPSASSP